MDAETRNRAAASLGYTDDLANLPTINLVG